ncbi:unnamed protein product [Ixodes pacificus]
MAEDAAFEVPLPHHAHRIHQCHCFEGLHPVENHVLQDTDGGLSKVVGVVPPCGDVGTEEQHPLLPSPKEGLHPCHRGLVRLTFQLGRCSFQLLFTVGVHHLMLCKCPRYKTCLLEEQHQLTSLVLVDAVASCRQPAPLRL